MRVRYRELALADLDAIFQYLNERSPAGAHRVLRAIYEAISGQYPFWIQSGASSYSLVVGQDGDVGLGTDSPERSLDIQGSSPDLRLYNTTSGRAVFYVNASGRTTATVSCGATAAIPSSPAI